MKAKSAINAIEKHGILLVYPIANQRLPQSLWSHFYPGQKMDWKWDDSGDGRVANLWHLREQLARSKQVVYAKWFQGRATFFSKDVFAALLHRLQQGNVGLSHEARRLLDQLDEDSPRSMKDLRKQLRKEWGWNDKQTESALKQLWAGLWIVGLGEVDDGAFPSLLVGSTRLMWEDLWTKAQKDMSKWDKLEGQFFSVKSPFGRFVQKASAPPKEKKKTLVSYEELVGK